MYRSNSNQTPTVAIFAGLLLAVIVIGALALGLRTPAAPVAPYEKTLDVAAH